MGALKIFGLSFAVVLAACSGEAGTGTDGSDLSFNGAPLACADPTVIREHGTANDYVYCTGMSHVWKTADWKSFSDVRSQVSFDAGSLEGAGSWWAPTIAWDAAHQRYVMWVSVPTDAAKDTRGLAVFASPSLDGKWHFVDWGNPAGTKGEMIIDPMLFRDHDGTHYLYWKRYGGPLTSRIMGARLDAKLEHIVPNTRTEIMDGYGGANRWEDNVRENPAVWRDPGTGHYHMLYSGAHWADGTYATGHAVSTCGPLCMKSGEGWRVTDHGDNGIPQVVQAKNDPNFTNGGPGGAVWTADGSAIVFAAAFLSNDKNATAKARDERYLMREKLSWSNGVPYVNTPKHHPHGF